MATIFYTPPGYSGTAELTASTGLVVHNAGLWKFSQAGYNDQATFGLSLASPKPLDGGELHLAGKSWTIAGVGNQLQSYYNPTTGQTYSAEKCRITVTGQWRVYRQQNSNSWNSFGISYKGHTHTDLGVREMDPNLLTYFSEYATYTIQGSEVTGGAANTFDSHEFYCKITETASSDNSNKEFQSNTTVTPIWAYTYSMSWEIEA